MSGDWTLASLDSCRSDEGLGPIQLPANWSALTPAQQGFVVMDLERVNRGLVPIVGLSASLNALAQRGAASGDDPPFPSAGAGGGIWAGASSVIAADVMWLYDDGQHGFDANADCAGDGTYCWMHRDIILGGDGGGKLVAGGAFSGHAGEGSYAYLIMSHYPAGALTFRWAHELRYFADRPAAEPAGSAAAARITALVSNRSLSAQHAPARRHHRSHRGKRHRRHRATHAAGGHAGAGDTLTISFS